jgi:hypothetical protein
MSHHLCSSLHVSGRIPTANALSGSGAGCRTRDWALGSEQVGRWTEWNGMMNGGASYLSDKVWLTEEEEGLQA